MNWVRSNILIVICLIVMLIGLVAFYWPVHTQRSAFYEEVSARQQQLDSIRQLQNATVEVPPEQVDAAPRELAVVVNQAAIEKLSTVYDRLNQQYADLYNRVGEINRRGHQPMLDGLFPEPAPGNENSRPYQARRAYLDAFDQLYQSMDAGTPPTAEEVDTLLSRAEQMTRRQLQASGRSGLSQAEQEQARRRQVDQLINRYQDIALQHHVYAEPPQTNLSASDPRRSQYGMYGPGGPSRDRSGMGVFYIGDWAHPGGKPNLLEIWEGQVQLWIQQDLVSAIRAANRMDDPDASLVYLPIKRVMSIMVEPGYVGAPPPPMPEGQSGASATATSGSDSDTAIDFTESATGRVTNSLYDVRHASLSLVVDSKRIPEVINAIHSVNFMTVIGVDTTEVDEYQALQEGYYYGEGDVTQLDLEIESIWLRSWTAGDESREQAEKEGRPFYAGLMPDLVRYRLGLEPRDPQEVQQKLENIETLTPGEGYGQGQGRRRRGSY